MRQRSLGRETRSCSEKEGATRQAAGGRAGSALASDPEAESQALRICSQVSLAAAWVLPFSTYLGEIPLDFSYVKTGKKSTSKKTVAGVELHTSDPST